MAKLVIKPYRQHMGIDQAKAEAIWESLRTAIEQIFSQNASLLSFEELYRNSYNLVLHKHGDLLYNGVVDVITEKLEIISKQVANESNDHLLGILNIKWDEHQVTMAMVRDILMYMDRTYVGQKRKLPIYDHGLYLFRDIVVRNNKVKDRLQRQLLNTIQAERHGELIDRSLMKNMLRMLVSLGIHSNIVYEEDFEGAFLFESLEFYHLEAQTVFDQLTCSDYLILAERRLHEEANRVTAYLNSSTEPRIRAIVETQLLAKMASQLIHMPSSGCFTMMRDNKVESLKLMYTLFQRVPGALDIMSEAVQEYIEKTGKELVDTQSNPETTLDVAPFIGKLLELQEKFATYLRECFAENLNFHRAVKKGFELFMNTNTVCASYLAQYIDEMLRSKARYEEELEQRVTNIVALFRHLQDKDVFEEFYKRMLSKRLLSSKGINDEAEKLVISKLKAECGYHFTSKLEGMFKDISISQDILDAYQRHTNANSDILSGITLNVQVLTSGYWPVTAIPPCVFPSVLKELANNFEAFYQMKHNGRKLVWMGNMGTVDMRATFYGHGSSAEDRGEPHRHELNVSTYQAIVLLLFTQRAKWSFKDLIESTEIPLEELKRHIISLCTPKCRILLKSSKGKRIDEEHDEFTINESFKSKLHRIRIPLVSQKESSLVSNNPGTGEHDSSSLRSFENLPPTVFEDRKHLVEAAIVRIMKTRRQMQHNDLIAEVTRQMSGRFTPSPQLIKLRIESLIERDYFQRSHNDRRVYNYLA